MNKTPKEILDEKLSQVNKFKNLSDIDNQIINKIPKTEPIDISDLSQYTSMLDNIITKETNNKMLHSGVHIEENEPMYTHDELKTKEEKAAVEREKAALEVQKAALEVQKNRLAGEKAALTNQKRILAIQKSRLEGNNAGLAADKTTLEGHKGRLEGENATLLTEKNALVIKNTELKTKLEKAKEFMYNTRYDMLITSNARGNLDLTRFQLKKSDNTAVTSNEKIKYKKLYEEVTENNWTISVRPIIGGNDNGVESPYITYGGAAGIIGGNILVNNCKCLLIGILILLVLYFIYIMVCECINSYKTKKYRYQYII